MSFYRARGKRLLDLCGAVTILALVWPAMVAAALAIVIEDGGPILFRQERCGRGGRYFSIFKFRSMSVVRAHVRTDMFELGGRARVTRVGSMLRRSKVDELPQLFNVLRGEMSLVGPRPEVRVWIEPYLAEWRQALTVRPGITDQASIFLRNEEDRLRSASDPQQLYATEILPLKWRYYDAYAKEYSFVGDVLILFRTVHAVLFR